MYDAKSAPIFSFAQDLKTEQSRKDKPLPRMTREFEVKFRDHEAGT
jgi:hypothetical protein